MSRLGEYLREHGALDEFQFEDACRSQTYHGGRIGSILVELGYLEPEELEVHLSNYHGVPVPQEEWLEAPDEFALKLIPNMLVRRFHVLPMRIEAGRIHVAMLDPDDRHQLNLIGEMAKRVVVPYVLPELRLLYWLEMHCGIVPHPRYANLSVRVRRGGGENARAEETESDFAPLADGEALAAESPIEPIEPPLPLAPRRTRGPQTPFDELLLEEVVLGEGIANHEQAKLLPAPKGPGEIASLELQLQGAKDPNTVIELGMRLASFFAARAALFVVRGDVVSGHQAVSDGVVRRADAVLLPTTMASLFTEPAITGKPFRGVPPHDGMDGRILEAIGCVDAQEVLVLPVALRGRVVNLLYADNGADALPDTSVAALRAVGAAMAVAYERLILESKLES